MASPAVVIPYLLSVLLGSTIDLRTYDIGPSIYDFTLYDEKSNTYLNATYHVVQGTSFPYSYFQMPIDIVLRIKAKYLTSSSGSMGLDGLLRDSAWKRDSVVVPIVVVYTTVERTLSTNATLISNWQTRIPQSHTHYATHFLQGGWFIAMYRFRCDVPSDVKLVRKLVTETLGVSGKVSNETIELLKKAEEKVQEAPDVRGRVKVETYSYSSIALSSPLDSNDYSKLIKVINDLPKAVGKKGEPLYMTLKPLHELDSRYSQVNKSESAVKDLEKLDECFDDVKNARSSLVRWIQDTDELFDDDKEERIYRLLESINTCLREFNAIVSDLSLYKQFDFESLSKSLNTYLRGLSRGEGSYVLAYRRLKEDIDVKCVDTFLHGAKGLLQVFEGEGSQVPQEVGKDELKACKALCIKDPRCRSIGYSKHVSVLDLQTGNYLAKRNQCWIFYRSTSTAHITSPSEYRGELRVYDRQCY